ncbi:MAG: YheT family hydrolase [Acidobacteriaceae bacterium]
MTTPATPDATGSVLTQPPAIPPAPIPALAPPFVPRRFLRNGHLQTLAGNFLPRNITLPEPESLFIEVDDPIDEYGPTQILCHCHWQPAEVRRRRPAVILVHGLEGSSRSQYIIGNSARALAAGCNVVRMNMRSCGGTDHLAPTIYHSGRSTDVARVVARILHDHQLESIVLVGYSMGGNLVLKALGEYGDAPPPQLKAVIGISPLMDLTPSSAALHEPANRIYEWHFLRNMRRRLRQKAQLFPRLYHSALQTPLRSMRDFDQHIVARYGHFRDADDYYTTVASSRYAADFRVPTLILHSTDDPFIRMLPSTRNALLANPHVTFVETRHGGHCAYLADPDPNANRATQVSPRDGYWAEHLLLNYLLHQTGHTHGS